MIDVQATPVEKVYQDQANAWRRQRFGQFAYRPGDRLPAAEDGRTYLQAFFRTPAEAEHERHAAELHERFRERGQAAYDGTTAVDWQVPTLTDIPAFHRSPAITGDNHCYACDGIGWLLYVRGQTVLAERTCGLCGGTGSWTAAEIRSGLPADTFHPIPPQFRGPEPGGPIPGSTAYLTTQKRRAARAVSGTVRAAAGCTLFAIVFCVGSLPLSFLTGNQRVGGWFAFVLGLVLVPIATRAVLGPLRNGEVFGPLWLLVAPVYTLAGLFSVLSTLARSDLLKTMSTRTFALAASARAVLARVPLGH